MTQARHIYSESTLAHLLHLNKVHLRELIFEEGKLQYSHGTKSFTIYVPFVQETITYEPSLHYPLKEKLTSDLYEIKQENILLQISSSYKAGRLTRPNSILACRDFEQILEKHFDLNEDCTVLLDSRATAPVFVGSRHVIERFAEDFDSADAILNLKTFLDWRKQNV